MIRSLLGRFLTEDSAQATTEYILILSVLVGIAIVLVRDLIRPVFAKLTDTLSKMVEEKMFQPGSMHRSPFHQ